MKAVAPALLLALILAASTPVAVVQAQNSDTSHFVDSSANVVDISASNVVDTNVVYASSADIVYDANSTTDVFDYSPANVDDTDSTDVIDDRASSYLGHW
ncbi:hypothetical protein GGF42_004776 [Coemansia sp. RSA 2424]|nr:hypothetical protein GGF42_004776 [Coemansia sp. RSA 2424]